jgi:hypothetical protein
MTEIEDFLLAGSYASKNNKLLFQQIVCKNHRDNTLLSFRRKHAGRSEKGNWNMQLLSQGLTANHLYSAGGLEVQQGMNETKHEAQTNAWKRGKGDAFLDRLEVATRTLTYLGQRRILSSYQQEGQAGYKPSSFSQ